MESKPMTHTGFRRGNCAAFLVMASLPPLALSQSSSSEVMLKRAEQAPV
jgi:hypothetical protein